MCKQKDKIYIVNVNFNSHAEGSAGILNANNKSIRIKEKLRILAGRDTKTKRIKKILLMLLELFKMTFYHHLLSSFT